MAISRGHSLLSVFLIEVAAICIIASAKFSLAATITLCLFNLLFTPFALFLNGSLNRKLALLTAGNALGLFWNFLLFHFYLEGLAFNRSFGAFYSYIFPALNLIWIVPYWSFSLSLLPKKGAMKG